ncbi:hypothetical protein F2Q68_00042702 [Brassica cretica]|uniref:Clp R domain-containing protein n=1 Tax=Brassica cretica TaxID=69181 RepID=A0A8S9MD03_BRACR|nr:hypothetical protein F2Q68_00042702 [Brassica cretica]
MRRDYRVPLSNTLNQTLPRCHLCNEKYLQEVAALVKTGSSLSTSDQCSEKLPSWLRAAESELDKGPTGSTKAIDDDTNTLASQTTALQKKWDNICQSTHQTPAFPKLGFPTVSPQFPVQTEKSVRSTVEKSSPGTPSRAPESSLETSKLLNNQPLSNAKQREDLTTSVPNRAMGSPLSCVTTDLGLGAIYASKSENETNTRREKPLLVTLNSSLEHKYQNDFKSLRESLSRKVPYQTEAVNAISQIICDARRNRTSGTWLALLGPDTFGKKKVASVLSEVFFGSQENCISVDFGGEHSYRGKTVVDYLTGELSRQPHSVVFLENVEKSEFPDQRRLSEAVSTGRLRDSHGRVISMKNVIVIIAKDKDRVTVEPVKFSEERVLNARSWKLQIKLSDSVKKRKREEETELRPEKVQRSYLDLNLPVDETGVSFDHETEEARAWFDGFMEQVDGRVTFKEVDFDGLAKSIREKIVSHFKMCFGGETSLEIDEDVMVQILAASWSSGEEGRDVVDQWMGTVLAPSFAEARVKYGLNPKVVVKLVASRDLGAGVELPEKALDDTNTLASQTTALQKKWDNICQSTHQTPTFPKLGFPTVSPQFPVQTEKSVRSTAEKSSPGTPSRAPESSLETSKLLNNQPLSNAKQREDLTTSVPNRAMGSPLSCVTTDLGLGAVYASKSENETNTRREKPSLATLNSSLEHKYQNDFKSLRESLSRKVPYQTEAVNAFSQIICDARRNRTSGTWLALLGPDRVGKKKVASVLSEAFFGGQENCISVDFGGEHSYRGKTVVDYLTGELSRKPHSVVFLENVEKAEFPDQRRLSEAVSTGRLRDSHGRVISMKNVIVLAASSIDKEKDHVTVEPVTFSEERVLSARSWKLQIKLSDGVKKRKHEGETELRAEKVQRSYLDLNLPVDETGVSLDLDTEDARAWFDGFMEQVDGKVMFKEVDFDGLAKSIREKIVSHFKMCFGGVTSLEIDEDVMVQILAASWSSGEEGRDVVDQWMRTVLAPSFAEARVKYGLNPKVVVKLVASRDLGAGVELPEKVDVM